VAVSAVSAALAVSGALVLGVLQHRETFMLCADNEGAEAFRALIDDVPTGAPVALGEVVPGGWDALWVFAEPDSIAQMERTAGVDLGGEPSALAPWGRSCAATTLVFVQGDRAFAVYSYVAGDEPDGLRRRAEPYRPDAVVVRSADGVVLCDLSDCMDVE
jgi:uncharacterized membrane protein